MPHDMIEINIDDVIAQSPPPDDAVGKKSKKTKEPKAYFYNLVRLVMNGACGVSLPTFPHRFYVVEPVRGVKNVLLETEPGIVEYVSDDALAQAILQYVTINLAAYNKDYCWDFATAKKCALFWIGMAEPIPEPPAVAWADYDGLTFSRMPWCYVPGAKADETPLYQEFLDRTSNARALMAWIGSLLMNESDLQQYVWMFGGGGNGKGALMRVLGRIFGRAYRAMQPPNSKGDPHFTSALVGMRLVAFPDCNAYGFPSSGLFKSLTGGDAIMINPKGKPIYSVALKIKYIFASNEKPQLSSEKADIRRVIYCEVGPIEGDPQPDYEDRLWAETGAFLSRCLQVYAELCPRHGVIPVDAEEIEEIVAVAEEEFEALVSQYFIIGESEACPQASWTEFCENKLGRDKMRKRDFIAYLARTYGLRVGRDARTSKRHGGVILKSYLGFRICYGNLNPPEHR